jgi:hypothetical protein
MGILWVSAIALTRTRTWRFVGFLVLISVLVAIAPALDDASGRVVAAGAAAFAAWALVSPWRFGLGSLTASELKAHEAFTNLEQAVDDPGGPRRAIDLVPALDALANAAPTDSWAIAARLFRRYLARLTEPRFAAKTEPPAMAFRNAGHAYWVIASWHRVIGGRRSPVTWDEDVLLRCLSEQFEDLISTEQLTGDPIDPAGSTASRAARVIDDTRACHLVHSVSMEARDQLVASMEADLGMAQGDRSPDAIDRQRLATEAVGRAWRRLTAADPRTNGT